ncbi:hypothetical protein ASE04_19045 [Rhizobium sp. Root708]|uniref:hypothetical protein n=1 Tax=Rhizobium sp. Root708 TaxID=1736592 RepID=UPI0006F6C3B1|nr:hypothetical protein [Rhizobium sp. Root708]KRB49266.1 hypothetical protein ASE04_19045 [Rhizobium sp. Root708]
MKMNVLAAAILSFGMASTAFAQSNPVPNNMAGDRSTKDAGGGASGDVQMQTGTSAPVIDPNSTNSTAGGNTNATGTVDRSRCPVDPAPGAVGTEGGSGGASVSDACPDNH